MPKRNTPKLLISSESSFAAKATLRKNLQRLLSKILEVLPSKAALIELHFVDSVKMKELNKKYRGKNKPTDVLSFHSDQDELLGSLVIDCQTAAIQAKEYQHSLEKEIEELFVHGCLHLLGLDHENSADADMMKAYECLFSGKKSS